MRTQCLYSTPGYLTPSQALKNLRVSKLHKSLTKIHVFGYPLVMNCVDLATPLEKISLKALPPVSANAFYFYWFTNPPAVLAGRSR